MTTKHAQRKGFASDNSHGESLIDLSNTVPTTAADGTQKITTSYDDSTPQIALIGDTADADINRSNDREQHLPQDLEGDLEDRIIREVKDHGVQSWTETTFYPQSNRTITRNYGNKQR